MVQSMESGIYLTKEQKEERRQKILQEAKILEDEEQKAREALEALELRESSEKK
jgi:hypothetical protein